MTPADVTLTAMLTRNTPVTNNPYEWELAISLDSASVHPLANESYHYHVYTIAPETPIEGPEYVSPGEFGNPGIQGDSVTAAIQRLKSEGFLPADFPETRSDSSVTGFAYYGKSFPAQVRYSLRATASQTPRVAIVYAHSESRWGKNLSWTKVFYPHYEPGN